MYLYRSPTKKSQNKGLWGGRQLGGSCCQVTSEISPNNHQKSWVNTRSALAGYNIYFSFAAHLVVCDVIASFVDFLHLVMLVISLVCSSFLCLCFRCSTLLSNFWESLLGPSGLGSARGGKFTVYRQSRNRRPGQRGKKTAQILYHVSIPIT